jgi:hypothetical protein
MKTTPALLKERRKQRRQVAKSAANHALLAICEVLILPTHHVGGEEGELNLGVGSAKEMSTGQLAALLRMGRKVRPLLDCARQELDRRYIDETYRRRRELKKQYKEQVLALLAADKAKAEVDKDLK